MCIRFFMIFIVAAAFGLAGCQTGAGTSGSLYGSGSLVISSQAEAWIQENRYGRNGIRNNFYVAIDERSRGVGGVYCSTSEIGACINAGDFYALEAVKNCNQDGRYNCAVYSIADRIIWDGPVYLRHSSSTQNLPYNGVWPVTLEWEADPDGRARLVGVEGELSIAGIGSTTCPVALDPTGSRDGRFTLRCPGGLTVRGDYGRTGGDIWEWEGRDSEGRSIGFRIDLVEGRGPEG